MKWPTLFESVRIFAEIRPGSIHLWTGKSGWELPLQRTADGRITPDCATRIATAMQELATAQSWTARARVYCAIPARGIVLRTLSMPGVPSGDLNRLIPLQVESQFPLPPDALAWSWALLQPAPGQATSLSTNPTAPASPSVLVAAVRKEVIAEYTALFQGLDPNPTFTPAALARLGCLSGPLQDVALLDLGQTQSELTRLTANGSPGVQSLTWGSQSFNPTQAAEGELGAQAKTPKDPTSSVPEATRLGAWLAGVVDRTPLWIVGPPEMPGILRPHLPAPASIRTVEIPQQPGATAATWGWQRLLEDPERLAGIPLVPLQSQPVAAKPSHTRDWPRRTLAVAVALLVAVVLFPYLEAWLLQPGLARRLQELRSRQSQLAVIDQEAGFFRYLEQNQAPQLDATFVIAQAAPPGTHLDQLTMNRQGSVHLSGYLRDLNQVGEFRLKLIQSGFFSSVVAEDQTQTPDRQRVNFRITAQWKDVSDRESLNLGPSLVATNTPRAGTTNPPGSIPGNAPAAGATASNEPPAKPSPSNR